jgi:3-hydroxymyristoyl/3-hydroxydecanoyl-(acyl carrier protein) dehydratase
MKVEIREAMTDVCITEAEATACFRFDETFSGFDGHFPGNLIVPGIALVQCGVVLAERIAGCHLVPTMIDSAKFTAVVAPGEAIQAKCALKDRCVTASFFVNEKPVGKMKVQVADA